ncbi:glycosyltransferase family 9 protein [Candidatus Woesearchaeota archaeon]|nr:glycosyltransferase family 9 protein [Candidatus Woesearchaeota archaeon]
MKAFWKLVSRSLPVRPVKKAGKTSTILIVNLQGAGDLLMTTPLTHTLKKKGCSVDVLCLAAKAEVLEGNQDVKKILHFQGLRTLRRVNRRNYDLIFLAHGAGPKSGLLFRLLRGNTKASHIYDLAGHPTSFGADISIAQTPRLHRVEENTKILHELGMARPSSMTYHYTIPQEARHYADKLWSKRGLEKKTVIGIHPGSEKKQAIKRYPISRYISLIQSLPPTHEAMVFLGPDEEELLQSLKEAGLEKKVVRTSLPRTAALLRKCAVVIHADTGLGHLAAAVGTRTVTIAGPTNWPRTKPYGKDHTVINDRKQGLPRDRPMEAGNVDPERTTFKKNLTLSDIQGDQK